MVNISDFDKQHSHLALALRGLYQIQSYPLFFTGLWGSLGLGMSVDNFVRGELTSGALVSGLGLTTGLAADGVRALLTRNRVSSWRNQDSDLAKVLGEGYLQRVIHTVKQQHGYSGSCQRVEIRENSQGTGIFQGGYFTRFILRFGDKEATLLYKYSDKPTIENGANVAVTLREAGFDFVPRVYSPFG